MCPVATILNVDVVEIQAANEQRLPVTGHRHVDECRRQSAPRFGWPEWSRSKVAIGRLADRSQYCAY